MNIWPIFDFFITWMSSLYVMREGSFGVCPFDLSIVVPCLRSLNGTLCYTSSALGCTLWFPCDPIAFPKKILNFWNSRFFGVKLRGCFSTDSSLFYAKFFKKQYQKFLNSFELYLAIFSMRQIKCATFVAWLVLIGLNGFLANLALLQFQEN